MQRKIFHPYDPPWCILSNFFFFFLGGGPDQSLTYVKLFFLYFAAFPKGSLQKLFRIKLGKASKYKKKKSNVTLFEGHFKRCLEEWYQKKKMEFSI